jgi:hypothetical protein
VRQSTSEPGVGDVDRDVSVRGFSTQGILLRGDVRDSLYRIQCHIFWGV